MSLGDLTMSDDYIEVEIVHEGSRPLVYRVEPGGTLYPDGLPPGTYTVRARRVSDAGASDWTSPEPMRPGDVYTIDDGALETRVRPDQTTYDETPASEPVALEDFAMTCCERPDPALLEKNNRMFCRNCRRYLDNPPQEETPDAAGDTGGGDAPDDQ